jgi:hypothetical protein
MENTVDRNTILRSMRTSLVNLFVDVARVIFFWIPGDDPAYGRALMTLHPFLFGIPVLLFFTLSFKHPLRFALAVFFIGVAASQWMFKGCVITRAEHALTGQRLTIIDPFLTLAGLPVDRNTRNAATIAGGTAVACILTWASICDYLFH